jgi:hypothetical protein
LIANASGIFPGNSKTACLAFRSPNDCGERKFPSRTAKSSCAATCLTRRISG